jgi:hypothetical protein
MVVKAVSMSRGKLTRHGTVAEEYHVRLIHSTARQDESLAVQ